MYVSKNGIYYLRDRKRGVDTHISLKTKKLKDAQSVRRAYYGGWVAHKLGLAYHPDRPRVKITECLELFTKADYPDADGNSRPTSDNLDFTKRSVELLTRFFGHTAVEELDQDQLDHYKAWRAKHVKQGSGFRTVDRELSILSNALDWATRKKLVDQNPSAERVRYRKASKSRHAKDVARVPRKRFTRPLEPCFWTLKARPWAGNTCGCGNRNAAERSAAIAGGCQARRTGLHQGWQISVRAAIQATRGQPAGIYNPRG